MTMTRRNAMKRFRDIALIMGLCAGAATSAAWAESGEFVGRWHWDRAQSTVPPGEPAPDDVTIEISRADRSHLSWSLTVLTSRDSGPHVETFDAPADGEFRPINSDTTASFRLTGGTLQATFKGPTGQLDAMTCTLSTNNKMMTCNGATSRGAGQTTRYVDVYDKM
jgi:hypothetical protein